MEGDVEQTEARPGEGDEQEAAAPGSTPPQPCSDNLAAGGDVEAVTPLSQWDNSRGSYSDDTEGPLGTGGAQERERQPVALRVELATKRQAQVMQWALYALVLVLVVLSIVLIISRGELQGAGAPRGAAYHKAVLIIASMSQAALVIVGVVFFSRVRQSLRDRMIWTRKHVALAVDAGVMVVLVGLQCVFWVAATAAVVGAGCTWPVNLTSGYQLARDTLSTLMFVWLLISMHGMTRCRTAGEKKARRKTGQHNGALASSPPSSHTPVGAAAPANGSALAAAAADEDNGDKGQRDSADAPAPAGDLAAAGPEAPGCAPAGPAAAAKLARTLSSAMYAGGTTFADSAAAAVGGAAAVPMAAAANALNYHPPRRTAAGLAAAEAAGALLVVDQPLGVQLRIHMPKLLAWGLLEGLVILSGVREVQFGSSQVIPMSDACATELGLPPSAADANYCGLSTTSRIASALQAIIIVGYFALYIMYQRRAFKDHASLPYNKYRMTNLYIRVQARHATVVLACLVVTNLIQKAASTSGSCWSFLEGQVGSLTTVLSIMILGLTTAILYTPLAGFGATLLQTLLQEFGWTRAGMPAARARRRHHLQALGSVERGGKVDQATDYLMNKLAPGLAPALGAKSSEEGLCVAKAELAKQPMLCMEHALRLLYWARVAYAVRKTSHPCSTEAALGLYGLAQYDVLHEPASETLAVVGWGGPGHPVVLLSFRGTDNMQNVLTDINFFKTDHLPRRRWHGKVVEVHRGFYNAWRGGGFSERVLGKLDEVVGQLRVEPSQLTFYITGHSLGGALAILAAYEVAKRFPQASLRCYTYGAPRVGNSAWTGEYNATVRETWCIVNHNDPVPRIPKGLFKRSGQRVTINMSGDIIVRPTYFELSVILKTGGTVQDHMTSTYAKALASILKAQFSEAKCLPGGREGVAALAGAVDLGHALVMAHMDLPSLEDPALQPALLEEVVAAAHKGKKRSLFGCCAPCAPGGPDVQQVEGIKASEQWPGDPLAESLVETEGEEKGGAFSPALPPAATQHLDAASVMGHAAVETVLDVGRGAAGAVADLGKSAAGAASTGLQPVGQAAAGLARRVGTFTARGDIDEAAS